MTIGYQAMPQIVGGIALLQQRARNVVVFPRPLTRLSLQFLIQPGQERARHEYAVVNPGCILFSYLVRTRILGRVYRARVILQERNLAKHVLRRSKSDANRP